MQSPLRDQVLALLDKWATENKNLFFRYSPPGCHIEQGGRVVKTADGFRFRNQSGMRITLRPAEWASAEIEEADLKTSINVEATLGEGKFSIGEDLFVERATPEDIVRAADQFARWREGDKKLNLICYHDHHITFGTARLKEVSPTEVSLLDEKTAKLNIISLAECRCISVHPLDGFYVVKLEGDSWDYAIQISDVGS